jgi:EAL domain-containing protein (putative c-di-GMP-specific phosphodiesterase class I)
MVPPLDFIHVAEDIGLIVPLGEWVLNAACKQNKSWQDAGFGEFRVAVNLSPIQFRQKSFRQVIDATLENTGLPPQFLELEITESAVMKNEEEAIQTMAEIMGRGIGLSMDDFGSGYSSLNYLKRFSLDTLKIDRAFVKDLDRDADDRAITAAIVAMAHSLGLKVVAEGVENNRQMALLEQQGCDLVQGYLISPPCPPKDLERFVETLGH